MIQSFALTECQKIESGKMSLTSFRGTATGLFAMALCVGAATVPAAGAPTSPATTVSLAGGTFTGCGVQDAPPLMEALLTGGDLRGVTLNADGSRLYASRTGKADTNGIPVVSVLNTQTMAQVAAMPVPGYHPYVGKVSLNPAGTKGYLPTHAPTVQVFETSTNTMTTTIPVEQQPQDIKFSGDGSRAYVVHYNNAITVLDTRTDTVLQVWNFGTKYGTFNGLEIDPTGAYAYVSGAEKWAVFVVDLKTGSIVDEIPLGGPAGPMALTRDGRTLYVMDRYHQRTLVLNLVNHSIEASFPVVGETLLLSDSENRAYIPRPALNNIGVIDLTTNALICSHWSLPSNSEFPVDIALSPGDQRLYIGGQSIPNRVSVLAVPEERNPTFTDVSAGTAYQREINWLATAGISTGYDDQTFRPLEPIRRDAMAAFLYRFHGSPAFTPPAKSPFVDVSPGDRFYKEITWLANMKITQGWPDGTYRPLQPVNRDAMAAFLYRTVDHARFIPPATSPFRDIQTNDPFFVEVSFMSATGVATGWSDGTFRPLQPVNRDAMAAFLFRLNPMATHVMR